MAEYSGLAELRQDLRSDDPGRFLDAADVVRDAGLEVENVLSDEPPMQGLVDADIVPASTDPTTAREQRQQIIDLLQQIAGGSA